MTPLKSFPQFLSPSDSQSKQKDNGQKITNCITNCALVLPAFTLLSYVQYKNGNIDILDGR